jgi:hypothetical protein
MTTTHLISQLTKKYASLLGEIETTNRAVMDAHGLAAISPDNDRMPAFIDHADASVWLGETPATPNEVKALLKTRPGTTWTRSREQKQEQAKNDGRKPVVSDPLPGFFG